MVYGTDGKRREKTFLPPLTTADKSFLHGKKERKNLFAVNELTCLWTSNEMCFSILFQVSVPAGQVL